MSQPTTRDQVHAFKYWRGASGRAYLFTAYPLVRCPPMDACAYILVRNDNVCQAQVLRVDELAHATVWQNLAELRHRAAKLGASHIHVHLLGESAAERRLIALDLRVQAFGALSAEPTQNAVST